VYLENKEYYWIEMSYHVYKALLQKERLKYEYEDEQYEILNRWIEQEVCEKFSYREE